MPAGTVVLEEVRRYIITNLDKDLSITTLATKAGINQDKLKAGFRDLTGETVHQFIIRERIHKAKKLLTETDKALKEIAALVGYSERNFYNLFKKHAGTTPGEFRKLF